MFYGKTYMFLGIDLNNFDYLTIIMKSVHCQLSIAAWCVGKIYIYPLDKKNALFPLLFDSHKLPHYPI